MDQEKLENIIQEIRENCPTNKLIFKYGAEKVDIHSLNAVKIEDGWLRYINISDSTIRYIDIGSIYEILVNKD